MKDGTIDPDEREEFRQVVNTALTYMPVSPSPQEATLAAAAMLSFAILAGASIISDTLHIIEDGRKL